MEASFYQYLFGVFSLLVGSFLNALIYRLPRNINIALPRSSCPFCKKTIYWYENIPVLSFLFLKGRCSKCGEKISLQYPIIELGVGIFGFIIAPNEISPSSLLNFFFYFSVFCSFLVHFIVDLKHQILPDLVNFYLGLIFFFFSLFSRDFYFLILGFVIGFGFPYLISFAFYKLKGQIGLGGGDIKLWGVLGLYLGPVGIIHNIFLSCFAGAVFGGLLIILKILKKENPIPFGPFILSIAFIQIFFEKWFDSIMRYIT